MLDEIKLTELNLREEATWGAKNIARIARVSPDLIYEWAKLPDCPITQPDGFRYFVLKSAFVRWLTAKQPRLANVSKG
jgi:hypothetical protein